MPSDGALGWLVGQADIGWSNRLGWYEGFHRLLSVNPQGVITGFSFAPASTSDPVLAEEFFGFRRFPHPRIATVGGPAQGYYIVDQGFEGKERHRHWHRHYGARVVCPPKGNPDFSRGQPWPKRWRSWVAGLRQIVETVSEKLHHTFRLDRERPHQLAGFQTRLAAQAALHHFSIWLNGQLGVSLWPLLICWTGDMTLFHTKRLRHGWGDVQHTAGSDYSQRSDEHHSVMWKVCYSSFQE
jgi:hypothetical protein